MTLPADPSTRLRVEPTATSPAEPRTAQPRTKSEPKLGVVRIGQRSIVTLEPGIDEDAVRSVRRLILQGAGR